MPRQNRCSHLSHLGHAHVAHWRCRPALSIPPCQPPTRQHWQCTTRNSLPRLTPHPSRPALLIFSVESLPHPGWQPLLPPSFLHLPSQLPSLCPLNYTREEPGLGINVCHGKGFARLSAEVRRRAVQHPPGSPLHLRLQQAATRKSFLSKQNSESYHVLFFISGYRERDGGAGGTGEGMSTRGER
eukprot:3781651-Rhodomonas_salina.2